ncbi:hypothetical protein [Streptomyces umbrinus]|uniref:hypothetical protein n=1 Tax=Streptomyces umbrinus TaxID=67370 RepID=UPI0033FBB5E8
MTASSRQPAVAQYVNVSVLAFLSTFVGGLLLAALYPSEGGQIRPPQEEKEGAQTVTIKIPGEVLSTLAFDPPKKGAGAAILIAFDAVAGYFVPGFDAGRPSADDASAEELNLRDAQRRLITMLPMG